MPTAFCPGHITCFFHPVMSYDSLCAGSRGVGIKLSRGVTVTVDERTDDRIDITMDGKPANAGITRLALRLVDPTRGFDVDIQNGLPVSQGFGMSAAGSIAAALCACLIAGKKRPEAFRAAHIAEIEGSGGRGDVAGIMCNGHQPVRTVAGLPPFGKVVDTGLKFNMNLAVLGEPLNTEYVLRDKEVMQKIGEIGPKFVDDYIKNPSETALFRMGRLFSKLTGLETPEVSEAISKLSDYGNAAMSMLGRSIYTTLPFDVVNDVIGTDAWIHTCRSTNKEPSIIRRG